MAADNLCDVTQSDPDTGQPQSCIPLGRLHGRRPILLQKHAPGPEWDSLANISHTSQLLCPSESYGETFTMMERAGVAARHMPQLRTMEIWNDPHMEGRMQDSISHHL